MNQDYDVIARDAQSNIYESTKNLKSAASRDKEEIEPASDGQLIDFKDKNIANKEMNSPLKTRYEMSPPGLSEDLLNYLDRLVDKKIE